MSGVQKQITFSRLWNKLPPLGAGVPGREVLELLYGSLWHLELAAEIDGGFSTDTMEKLHDGDPVPWQEWLNQEPTLSVHTDGNDLVVQYSFRTSLDPRLKGLIQTVLLANAALRLAGAWDILRVKIEETQYPSVLKNYCSILESDGNFTGPSSHFNEDDRVLKNVLIVIAFRDSMMHGEKLYEENFRGGRCIKKRIAFRELWIDGTIKRKTPRYSPAVIAQACRGVWMELVDCVKLL